MKPANVFSAFHTFFHGKVSTLAQLELTAKCYTLTHLNLGETNVYVVP